MTTERRLLDYHIYTWERFHKQLMPACTRLAGKPIVAATVILDLQGVGLLSFTTATRTLLSALAKIDQVGDARMARTEGSGRPTYGFIPVHKKIHCSHFQHRSTSS